MTDTSEEEEKERLYARRIIEMVGKTDLDLETTIPDFESVRWFKESLIQGLNHCAWVYENTRRIVDAFIASIEDEEPTTCYDVRQVIALLEDMLTSMTDDDDVFKDAIEYVIERL